MDNLREKVIKGLECCTADLMEYRQDHFCDMCPYKSTDQRITYCFNKRDLMADALSLLKAQEPRVMTLGEIINAKNIDVYLEEACGTQTHPLRLVETEIEPRNQASFFWPSIVRPLKSYGKTWRCWTSRPTDEQRKAVKWDEPPKEDDKCDAQTT